MLLVPSDVIILGSIVGFATAKLTYHPSLFTSTLCGTELFCLMLQSMCLGVPYVVRQRLSWACIFDRGALDAS